MDVKDLLLTSHVLETSEKELNALTLVDAPLAH